MGDVLKIRDEYRQVQWAAAQGQQTIQLGAFYALGIRHPGEL